MMLAASYLELAERALRLHEPATGICPVLNDVAGGSHCRGRQGERGACGGPSLARRKAGRGSGTYTTLAAF
jgi:hypothetical protein